MKKKLVVLSGAGISVASGIGTFRGAGGLWEGYDVQQVATPEAWVRNPDLVQRFYNERRAQVRAAQPNKAHRDLVFLEQHFDVQIITQNIDDLHERAGSSSILHLHGLITKSQSSIKPSLVYPVVGNDIKNGDLCELGSQLRPHVVWFGEPVPMIENAATLCEKADILLVIGTSLAVYPAAGLLEFVPYGVPKYIIDPDASLAKGRKDFIAINKTAEEGMAEFLALLGVDGKA